MSGKRSTVSDGHFEWVRVDTLTIDPEYQRPIKLAQVQKIVDEFDPDAVGVLLVSKRKDGSLVLLDGQQRQTAFLRMGWGNQLVPTMQYENLSPDAEARLFLRYNVDRVAVHPVYNFRARVAGAELKAVSIKGVLDTRGLVVRTATGVGATAAVGALDAVYEVGGATLLGWVLDTARAAWGNDKGALGQGPLIGLALFRQTYPSVKQPELVRKLRKRTVDEVMSHARQLRAMQGGGTATCVAQALVYAYNYRRPEKLDAGDLPAKFTKTGLGKLKVTKR